ncbi:MAG: amylo-alpha-1,6-glucosidase [Desulfohalobiaceae bacterium]|nr:amylo-alpha-1,6-glucosidase [Desulfohalobiaceae bacterium]
MRAYDSVPDLFIKIPGASFEPAPDWYRNFEYGVEQVRGLDFQEDLFTHGLFRVTLETGDQLGVVVSTEDPRERDAYKLLDKEKNRRLELLKTVPGQDDLIQTLALAADQFIVQRDRDFKTITVEINALWYNALAILLCLYTSVGQKASAQRFAQRAERMRYRFQKFFWYKEGGYLYDCVNGDMRDAGIRPNQIFALSLPFPLLEGQQAKMVLETITKKLRTPFGLRSLAPDDPHYRPVYQGNGFERDSAYHQGTVWAWLLGPWITALVRLKGQEGKAQARKYLREMILHFQYAGIGTVYEIFDAEWPHTPRGCIAQAWSVAEIIRAYVEDVLD